MAHQMFVRAPEGEVGWSLVELQGAIESRDGALDGLEFAQLERQPNGAPLLLVGTQAFEGQWVALKKPLAVTSKQPGAPGATGCEYHVKGVVRSKLVFKTRPVPRMRPVASKPLADEAGAATKRVRLSEDGSGAPPAE